MKNVICLMVLMLWSGLSYGQGTIRGTVKDQETQEPIYSAMIRVQGVQKGARTDFDGEFELVIAPGTYTLKISNQNEGYIDKEEEVVVTEGEVVVLNLTLSKNAEVINIGDVIVVAQKREGAATTAADDARRRDEQGATDGVTNEQMKEKGVTTVADAVTTAPGISVEDGKSVYVRGLGDRYTKTILNGMEIPGLDPDRNAVQLDIFPAAVVDNITVYKTFIPNLAGDFTGGLVDITTKDFPSERTIYAKAGLGYNTLTTFNSQYISYKGGAIDFLGFDDGTRALPVSKTAKFPNPVLDDPILETRTRAFSNVMAVEQRMNFLNQNYAFAYGDRIVFDKDPKNKKTYGYNFVLNYRNTYQFYEDVQYSEFRKDQQNGVPVDELERSRVSQGMQSENNVLWTALLGQSFKYKRSKLKLALFHTQNGQSSSASLLEENFEDNPATLEKTSLQYTQRSVSNLNLSGLHHLDTANAWKLEWKLSPTYSLIKDPDIRSTALAYELDANGDPTYSFDPAVGAQTIRIWRHLNEYNLGGRFDFTYTKKLKEDRKTEISFGALNTYKHRDFEVLQYLFDFRNGSDLNFSGDPNWYFQDENIWTPETDTGLYVNAPNGALEPANTFTGSQNVSGAYVMNEFPFTQNFKATYGLRVEQAYNWYTGQNNLGDKVYVNEKILDELSFLPSVNAVYKVDKPIDTLTVTQSMKEIESNQSKIDRYSEKYDKKMGAISSKIAEYQSLTDTTEREKALAKWNRKKHVLDRKNRVFEGKSQNWLDTSYQVTTSKRYTNIRGAYATTVARPSFKEKSLAQIYDPLQGRTFNGNIDLRQTTIHNFDLRWEYFFGRTELVSASAFYKRFIDPIEIVTFSTAPSNVKPLNTGTAQVYGVELELRKAIGFNNPAQEHLNFVIGTNFTYVVSKVDMRESFMTVGDSLISEKQLRIDNAREGEVIGNYRTMYGQSPYMINAFATFRNDSLGLVLNVSYNVQGKKLAVIGTGRIPDVYEQPFHSLSLKASKTLGADEAWKVSLTGKNLLMNARRKFYESYNATPQIYSYLRPGMTITASVSYNLTGRKNKEKTPAIDGNSAQ